MRIHLCNTSLVNYRLPQTIPYHRVARHARAVALQHYDNRNDLLNNTIWEPPLVWLETGSNEEEVNALSFGFFEMSGDSDRLNSNSESEDVTYNTPIPTVSSGDARSIVSVNTMSTSIPDNTVNKRTISSYC